MSFFPNVTTKDMNNLTKLPEQQKEEITEKKQKWNFKKTYHKN